MARLPSTPLPPAEFLREILEYHPKTGTLTWRKGPRAGTEAGCAPKRKRGATQRIVKITYQGVTKPYLAKRIVWKMEKGEEPPAQLWQPPRPKNPRQY